MSVPCFVPADILLPAANISLDPWACIAVDQFTSQPEYWQRAEELAAGKPSTLRAGRYAACWAYRRPALRRAASTPAGK